MVNDECGTEGAGMAHMTSQMQSSEVGMKHFKMMGAANGSRDDDSSEGKLVWTSLSCTQVLKVAQHFDVEGGYPNNPAKGELMGKAISDFRKFFLELCVWPGERVFAHARISSDMMSSTWSSLSGAP